MEKEEKKKLCSIWKKWIIVLDSLPLGLSLLYVLSNSRSRVDIYISQSMYLCILVSRSSSKGAILCNTCCIHIILLDTCVGYPYNKLCIRFVKMYIFRPDL